MAFDYVIIQAGGKGSRLGYLTENKPKALLPVENLPMIFHLFKKYKDKKFIIIGDYKFDVLKKYMEAFCEADYKLINAGGYFGTCAGLKEALTHVPSKKEFLLIWSDIILSEDFCFPEAENNIIGLSESFWCRWSFLEGVFKEERSKTHGVAGAFLFKSKDIFQDLPESGEFVRYLSGKNHPFDAVYLKGAREIGVLEEYEKLPVMKCRPFNAMEIKGNRVYKSALNQYGAGLAEREIKWYKKARALGVENIPSVYGENPLCMEYIDGSNIYELGEASVDEKRALLKKIVLSLKKMHEVERVASDEVSYYDAYVAKTFDRLEKIRNLVPFAEDEFIVINERICRNIFFIKPLVESAVKEYFPESFCFIHGDCTFSNILADRENNPVFIDPRGYFGKTEFYGDECYDWVKLYYSLVSNYDFFNLKKFKLSLSENKVKVKVDSGGWEELEEYFFELIGREYSRKQLKLFLGLIWLSLTTYAWENYDSVLAAFYIGLYYLQEGL